MCGSSALGVCGENTLKMGTEMNGPHCRRKIRLQGCGQATDVGVSTRRQKTTHIPFTLFLHCTQGTCGSACELSQLQESALCVLQPM